ncbi:hypothetical protein [Sphaerisporangium perillae]|uniref:hypothetical protein n=1 Tax=Sphaerisporangium perillae TaxID=2935860 RepID=UPI00200C8A3E|nr:hypothetical protein [Sphaerisporangium perillae]
MLALDCWATELHASFQQTRRLRLQRAKDLPLSAAPTTEEVRTLFAHLELALPDEYADDGIDEIIKMALGNADPYQKAARWG